MRSLYNRRYSDNVINRLYQFFGNEFGEYAEDWMDNQAIAKTIVLALHATVDGL